MSERERFEAWARGEKLPLQRSPIDPEQYERGFTIDAWEAWQAGAASARSGQAACGSSQGARSDVQNGVGQPEAGFAEPTEKTRLTVSGRKERVWRAL